MGSDHKKVKETLGKLLKQEGLWILQMRTSCLIHKTQLAMDPHSVHLQLTNQMSPAGGNDVL